MSIAGIAGRHDAVEHIDARCYSMDDVQWRTDAHQISRLVRRHSGTYMAHDLAHLLFGLSHRQTTDRIAIETDDL